jgi:hypothetical protein
MILHKKKLIKLTTKALYPFKSELKQIELFHKKHGVSKETVVNDIRNIHYTKQKPKSRVMKALMKTDIYK